MLLNLSIYRIRKYLSAHCKAEMRADSKRESARPQTATPTLCNIYLQFSSITNTIDKQTLLSLYSNQLAYKLHLPTFSVNLDHIPGRKRPNGHPHYKCQNFYSNNNIIHDTAYKCNPFFTQSETNSTIFLHFDASTFMKKIFSEFLSMTT